MLSDWYIQHSCRTINIFKRVVVTFRFMHISSGDTQSETQPSTLPRHMVQLTLSLKLGNKTQAIHQSMEAEFSKKEKWSKMERDVHKLENTQMYKHQSVEQLAVGVKLSGSGMSLISTKYHVKVLFYSYSTRKLINFVHEKISLSRCAYNIYWCANVLDRNPFMLLCLSIILLVITVKSINILSKMHDHEFFSI